MGCLNYPDSVTFVTTTIDGYGAESEDTRYTVPAIVVQNTGAAHGDNQEAITSSTTIYVDPENEFVQDNYYRLEEVLVVIPTFGGEEDQNWYKIIEVNISKDHLLCNNVDNVELALKKTASLIGV